MKDILGQRSRPLFVNLLLPSLCPGSSALSLPPTDFLKIHLICFTMAQLPVASGALEKREVSEEGEEQK